MVNADWLEAVPVLCFALYVVVCRNAVFCVLELLNYNNSYYALFSKETDKVEYVFYEVIKVDGGYTLLEVEDDKLNFALFELIEMEEM